jgi:hypothetical protein
VNIYQFLLKIRDELDVNVTKCATWQKDAVEEFVAGFSVVAGRIYGKMRIDVGSTQYFSRRT